MNTSKSGPTPEPIPVTDDQARRLLGSLLEGDATTTTIAQSATPVMDLIARLGRDDGERWFQSMLRAEPFTSCGADARELVEGRMGLPQLQALKDSGKSLFAKAGCAADARIVGVGAYCFAFAAALRFHGAKIGARPREEMDLILIELATVVPEPWSSMLSQAAFVEMTGRVAAR